MSDELREAATMALRYLTLSADQFAKVYGEDALADEDAVPNALRAALAARPGREQEAYDAGRLAGYEEGLAARPDSPTLDVGRLARAMDLVDVAIESEPDDEADHAEHLAYARDIAREYAALAPADPTADPEDAETYNNVAPRADAIAACDFRPANEPWQCVVHYGIRTRLDEPQCDAIRPAKPLTPGQLANLYEADAQGRVPHNRYLVRGLLATIAALRPATPGALDAAWAEASDVVAWDWTLRLTRLVKGGYRAEAINGNKVEVYTVASDPDDALRELSDIITESHVND